MDNVHGGIKIEITTAALKTTVNEFILVKSGGINNFHSRVQKELVNYIYMLKKDR